VDGGSFTLCALVPPGSVEAEVGRIQEAIFSAHGLTSAVALPPLIPIAFLPAHPRGTVAHEPARALLDELDGSVSAPWRVTITRAAWVGGFLCLGIDSGGMWDILRARARGGGEADGPFPAAEGFFLGCGEASAGQRGTIRPPVPALSFTSGSLALVGLETAGGGPWWGDLFWEIIEERPLRGRRTK
jgi:hypothetical protein